MMLLAFLLPFIAITTSAPFNFIPGDNSHYVEGESRFIWMSDGENIPYLVDLEEPYEAWLTDTRNGANNQYWLYTRENPTTAQILVHGDASSIYHSNYKRNRPLKVLVHGWRNSGYSVMNPLITTAFLAAQDCNVIVVDWHSVASTNYVTAIYGVPGVGQFLGNFLEWLISTAGGDWNSVHLVGFSLGAHVVGNAGRTTGGKPRRVSGLDPAGPLWSWNSNALNKYCGQYVESIHTDGGSLGIFDPISDADFYPNGGRHPQPGCSDNSCSHARAPEIFASSIHTDHFVGRLCDNLKQAQNTQCFGNTYKMGNAKLSKTGFGLYGLTTSAYWPF